MDSGSEKEQRRVSKKILSWNMGREGYFQTHLGHDIFGPLWGSQYFQTYLGGHDLRMESCSFQTYLGRHSVLDPLGVTIIIDQ